MNKWPTTPTQMDDMRTSGWITASTLATIKEFVRPGMTLLDIDREIECTIEYIGGKPALKGYQPLFSQKVYPFSSCLALNNVVAHGLPNDTVVAKGDILGVDIVVEYKGWHTDAATTFGVGPIAAELQDLLDHNRKALDKAIAECKPGTHIGDIGFVIAEYARQNNYGNVTMLTGHGIGSSIHDERLIINNDDIRGRGRMLEPGMAFCIEPMFTMGSTLLRTATDGWSLFTDDIASHFEDTILITEQGCEILTHNEALR